MPDRPLDTIPPEGEGHYAFGLTPIEVERFRDIMRSKSGSELTTADAWARAIEMLALFRALLGPHPEDPTASVRTSEPLTDSPPQA
jgi:hypothetical protein